MKSIGIFLIICGHLLVPGNHFIYVFNVPLFFILSGFLSKRENNRKIFWNKIWWNLIVPTIILFLINMFIDFSALYIKGNFKYDYIWQRPVLSIIGMQGQDYNAGGLGVLWFVYTLIICKILLQFIPNKHECIFVISLCFIMLVIAYILNIKGVIIYNSIVNCLLCFPFFSIGYLLRPLRTNLSNIKSKYQIAICITSLIIVLLCGQNNETVMLYKNSYGNNILLCLIGGFSGTCLIYSVSLLLNNTLSGVIQVISGGTLLVLGLHYIIIHIVWQFINVNGLFRYIESIIILLMLIPLIIIVRKYFPILYGKLR